MGKLGKLADRVVNNRIVGKPIRHFGAQAIDHFLTTRADAVGELIDRRRQHVPSPWEVHTPSEAILYELSRHYGYAIADVVDIIREDGNLDIGKVTRACRRRLETFTESDTVLNTTISNLEDPVSKAVLRWILINRQRWLDFCIYLEDEKIDTTEKLIQRSPCILDRFSYREEEAIRSLLTDEESPVIVGLLNLALEFNRVTRERRQKQRVEVRPAV